MPYEPVANNYSKFPQTMRVDHSAAIIAANTAMDGTGAVSQVTTGDVNGTRIDKINVTALGANPATVMRFFINDGLGNAAANNTLIYELTLAASTATQTAANAVIDVTVARGSDVVPPIPYLAAGQKLVATIGTAGTAGWQVTAFAGDY